MKRILVLSFLLPYFLFQCSTFVRDTYSFPEEKEGFLDDNTFQFWYIKDWANDQYAVSGLQLPKKNQTPVRFIDLVDSAKMAFTSAKIYLELNRRLSMKKCGDDRQNILDQIGENRLDYRVVREEYFFNGMVRYLIRVRGNGLVDRIESSSCT